MNVQWHIFVLSLMAVHLQLLYVTSDLEDFSIPELPAGQHMVINIKTTWGDRHYVGLSGIEIFANTGEPVSIAKVLCSYVSVCSMCVVKVVRTPN